MKYLIMVLFLLVVPTTFNFAIPIEKNKVEKPTTVVFTVGGTCYMCKVRIEEALKDAKGVKKAVYDLKKKKLKVVYTSSIISLSTIKQKVADAGHDTDTIKATQKTYDNLHFCCKYQRVK